MKIVEWTEKSWNPITGCDKISSGCANCYAKEAADNRYIAEVTTREINISSLTEVVTISRELWVVGSFSHDQEMLTFVLRGPGDATKQGPGRYLSRTLIGSVPSSGTLVIS